MITLSFANEPELRFNLKSKDRERQLYFAWKAMYLDTKFGNKNFIITPDVGERFTIKVQKITDCFYEDRVYMPDNPMYTEGTDSEQTNYKSA